MNKKTYNWDEIKVKYQLSVDRTIGQKTWVVHKIKKALTDEDYAFKGQFLCDCEFNESALGKIEHILKFKQ